MRVRRWKLVVTFDSTQEAMHMEHLCEAAGIAGRLIPIPTAISAGCGLCWCSEETERERLEELIEEKLEGKEIMKIQL